MKSPFAADYIEAAAKEYKSLESNGTWELVRRPPDQRVIGTRWVFRPKVNPDGTFSKFKATSCSTGAHTALRLGLHGDIRPNFALPCHASILFIRGPTRDGHSYHGCRDGFPQ